MKNRMEKLLNSKRNLEAQPEYQLWLKWQALPGFKKAQIIDEWNEYYKNVHETPAYLLYAETNKAWKERNFTRVKELSEQARMMIANGDDQTIKQPSSVDPADLRRNFGKAYESVLEEIAKEKYSEEESMPGIFE